MNQATNQLPSRHSQYEPYPWIFWIRIAQLVLTVLVIVLSAYAASQSLLGIGVSFSFWTITWSIIWVPVATWAVTRMPARYRPNIIVLVFECFSVLWWLITFASMAVLVTGQSLIAGVTTGILLKRNPYSTYSAGSSSSSSIYDPYDTEDYLGNYQGALAATKAACAFSAINWVLFVATLVAISVKIHRQRRDRVQEIYQGASDQGNMNNARSAAVQVDKEATATTNPVPA